jgi:hypothetical protein
MNRIKPPVFDEIVEACLDKHASIFELEEMRRPASAVVTALLVRPE